MKKVKSLCAVLGGIMLILLAGCGNQPAPVQPEADETGGTAMTGSSTASSQSSQAGSACTKQIEPAASETGPSVPRRTAEQEKSSAGLSAPTTTPASPGTQTEQGEPPERPTPAPTRPDTPSTSRPTEPETDEPAVPPQTEGSKPTKPTQSPATEPADPVYTQADYDRIIREATAYAEGYAEKGFTFEWKDSMEFGWDVGYMGTPRIKRDGLDGTIRMLKYHIDWIVETGTNPAYGIPSDSVTYKVVQITIDGDIAFAVIYGG